MKSNPISPVILALFLISAAGLGQSRRILTPADILRVTIVGDAQISPDGELIVYTASVIDDNQTVNNLWLVRGDRFSGGPPTSRQPEQRRNWEAPRTPGRLLLPPGWHGTSPRWSPDGRSVAFLATHDGQHGIWVTGIGRLPRFVAEVRETNFFLTYAGESFAWSPDSKMIAYISGSEELDAVGSDGANRSDDPKVIDRIQYKSRTALSDRLRSHVWIVELEKPEPELRQLTSGPAYDHALNFSPRGGEIVFLSNHETDPDANNNSDIFAVNLQGQVRQITQTPGCEYEPTWSPDGKLIAYLATTRDVTTIDSVAEDTHVWVVDAAGGARREINSAMDRRSRSPRWSPDSKVVYFLFNDHGLTQIGDARVDCTGSDCVHTFPSPNQAFLTDQRGNAYPLTLPSLFQITSFSLSKDASYRIAFTLSDPLHPAEVWTAAPGRKETMRPLSAHNEAIRANVLVEPETFSFKTSDGTSVQGWIMKPIDWREDRKYPLIFNIHGGPHGMFGYAFNSAFQVYAARGYGVLFLNPRGSNGYGQKFSDGTINEWGGGDYKDLMLGVDEALRKYPWIDPNRMAVTGASYGGFMTNWIVTQTPRFRAAVSVASLSNLISFYSTSLYQDLIHAEFGGFPWDNFELLWQWSPLRYARQVQTPTLFIHGEQDNDVHITQAEEMYMALRRRNIETVLVRYPREGHGLREPKHRVDALERTLAWFDRFLK